MARDIPMDGPLSDRDRKYLEDRGRYAEIARVDQEFGTVSDDESDEVEDEAPDYDNWTVAELQSEIDSRNADRSPDSQLLRTGKKPELAERLRADDAAVDEGPF